MRQILIDTLHLSEDNYTKYQAWHSEQNKKAIELQKETVEENNPFYITFKECWEMGFPYTGTNGGHEKVIITPTSIGDIIMIENCITNDKLDLTDYTEW